MATIGYYYLHTNGDLIYKRELGDTAADLRESDFVRCFWPVDPEDRSCAWRLLVEATACDARQDRIDELATKWGCTDEDGHTYADHIGVRLSKDGSKWCATRQDFDDLGSSPAGFGDTVI